MLEILGNIKWHLQAPTAITQEAGREVPKESHNPPAHSRVVIIGASMAGLTAAAALSQEFDEVILLERDSCSNMDVRLCIQPSFSRASGVAQSPS